MWRPRAGPTRLAALVCLAASGGAVKRVHLELLDDDDFQVDARPFDGGAPEATCKACHAVMEHFMRQIVREGESAAAKKEPQQSQPPPKCPPRRPPAPPSEPPVDFTAPTFEGGVYCSAPGQQQQQQKKKKKKKQTQAQQTQAQQTQAQQTQAQQTQAQPMQQKKQQTQAQQTQAQQTQQQRQQQPQQQTQQQQQRQQQRQQQTQQQTQQPRPPPGGPQEREAPPQPDEPTAARENGPPEDRCEEDRCNVGMMPILRNAVSHPSCELLMDEYDLMRVGSEHAFLHTSPTEQPHAARPVRAELNRWAKRELSLFCASLIDEHWDDLVDLLEERHGDGVPDVTTTVCTEQLALCAPPTPPTPPTPPSGQHAISRRLRQRLQRVHRYFLTFDADGDGTLSSVEAFAHLRSIVKDRSMPPITDADAKDFVSKADLDGDGHLDFEEYRAMWLASRWEDTVSSTLLRTHLGDGILDDDRAHRLSRLSASHLGKPSVGTLWELLRCAHPCSRSRCPPPPQRHACATRLPCAPISLPTSRYCARCARPSLMATRPVRAHKPLFTIAGPDALRSPSHHTRWLL